MTRLMTSGGGGGGGGIIHMVDKTLIKGFYKIFVGSGGASGVTGYNSKIITLDGKSVIFDGLSVVGKRGGKGATCMNCLGQHGGSGGGGNKFGGGGGGTYGWLKCCGGRGASGVVVLRFVNCPSGTFANISCDYPAPRVGRVQGHTRTRQAT
jgi:hypothetical protein